MSWEFLAKEADNLRRVLWVGFPDDVEVFAPPHNEDAETGAHVEVNPNKQPVLTP